MLNSKWKSLNFPIEQWGKIFKRWMSEENTKIYDCGPIIDDRGICAVKPCDSDICHPQPRVIIIGAGMAGLSAAARLAQRGIDNIAVLEANERPGGRINSCWLGDIVAELGAHWRPDNCFTHLVHSLAATENPPRPGVPGALHTRGLFNKAVTGKMAYPPTISAYYKFRQIEEEAAQLYCLGGNKQHGSLVNFMSLRIQQELHEYPPEQQEDAARIMFGLAHILSARCASDTALLRADHSCCFMNMPGGEVRVPLGLIATLAPILRQIPEGVIRYCKPVNSIYWGTSQKAGHRAIVCACDGEEFPADYVITTVSLGVLGCNAGRLFCPTLSAAKIDAMRCLGYGYCNKIFLEYCRPFWFWHKGDLNFNYQNNELSCQSNWTKGITAIEMVPNSNHVICVWVAGEEAMAMECMSDKDVAEDVTDVLRCSTGNQCLPYPVSVLRSRWISDPFFCGSYSYEVECTGGEAQRTLACPLPGPGSPIPPILLFAGEATVPGHFATVAGARISGIREAERIVQLTMRYKGPPIPVECQQAGAKQI
ncbi:peroxisomal N(1)-acetyl-spermine/spermidine oxidase [Papilio machaon]|uniref:peroxisomal N(1)-acetyl-spermine/spermidine oxidase n=1 Tax=Papilio machaon TaxID=76193 RepID=UPI001E663D7F|nr:peroxisomal N(1)-acetyl-spermine/spermidine oxidase [Papilio machaon]